MMYPNPAHRGGRGGGGNRQYNNKNQNNNRGGNYQHQDHRQRQGQRNWDSHAGPSSSGRDGGDGGFMIDRGGSNQFRGGGRGSHNNHGHGSRNRSRWDDSQGHNRDYRNHRGQGRERESQQEVVDVDASDDDNDVSDVASGSRHQNQGRKRRRSSGEGHSSHKKHKRNRSRSNDDRDRRDGKWRNDDGRGNRNRDRQSRHHDQRDSNHHGRWNDQNQQQNNIIGGATPMNPPPLMYNNPMNPMMMNQMGIMGAAPNPHMPFILDNIPNSNMFDPVQFQQMQMQIQCQRMQQMQMMQMPPAMMMNQGHDQRDHYDHRGGRGPRNDRGRWGADDQEQRRLHVSQSFPRKVFLEEVNLDSDFAFRLDTNSNPGQMNYRSIAMCQKSTYEGGVGKGILGASADEITKVYSKFHAFRCKLPDDVNTSDSDEEDESDADKDDMHNKKKKSATSDAKNFISIANKDVQGKGYREIVDISGDFDSYSFDRKDGEVSIKEKVEYYNKEVRNQPQNISLWKEFVTFQDKVFEESNMIFDQEEEDRSSRSKQRSKKKKSNRKLLLEKKISIVEKALETNPNCLQLHLLRMEFLLDLYKPRHVLTEWKKLVMQHQQSAPFWMEYLLFSVSQLLTYSNSSTLQIFDSCFQKFRLMMNPSYPEFQRPKKFLLFISDITFGLSLLLKNAGYMEQAIALHQSQLEFDFNCPLDINITDGDISENWKKMNNGFEEFWKLGSPRFGEIGFKGWEHYSKNSPTESVSVAVSDSTISKFEEETMDSLNVRFKENADSREDVLDLKHSNKSHIWVCMESWRSKFYWLPWRALCSDVEEEDCNDAQRIISSSAVTTYISPLPVEANFISKVDRPAAHFRHIVNFLITMREDFVTHTQSVDYVSSPFLSTTLNESSSLFTEIYYWRKLIDLYVEVNNPENISKFHHVFAPEGFKLCDLTMPNLTISPTLQPTIFNVSLADEETPNDDDNKDGTKFDGEENRLKLLNENNDKYMEMFYRVIEYGLENLQSEFSEILFEMLLRFEQKLTCTETGKIKQRCKYAKALMKREKLRNAIGGYRELAMLEYFGGNSEKAVDLLIKTINATRNSLNCEEWDQIKWEENWKLILDLISLYRQLAELYLRNGTTDPKAYYSLVQLGNCFKSIDSDVVATTEDNKSEEGQSEWAPTTNILLKATRSFEKVMSMLIPNFKDGSNDEEAQEVVSNDVYLKWGGEHCVEYLLQQKNLIVEWTSCYALFQYFSKNFDAASKVYETVLKKLGSEQFTTRENYNPEVIRMHIREQLYINWCNLAARCLSLDPLMNSKFRSILSMALEEFPSSPPLLILFTDVENQTSVAGKLWRLMMNNMKPDLEKMVTHWAPLIMGIGLARKIEELEHDEEVGLPCFGLGGPAVPQDTIFYKLDSMISVAEQHPGVRNCPLVWRVHLKMLALRSREGKDVERAKKIFYDAVQHCPSSKSIYLDAITYFPELLREVNELMAEKQLLIRLPMEELDVLLEIDEDNGSTKHENNEQDNDDITEINDEDVSNECSAASNKNKSKKRKERESKSEGEIGDSD